MSMLPRNLLFSLGLSVASTLVHAAPVAVVNPGFEAQAHGPNTFIFGAPVGWASYNTENVSGD